jgi:hypothetical protein
VQIEEAGGAAWIATFRQHERLQLGNSESTTILPLLKPAIA